MTAIINYGAGNLHSICSAFNALNVETEIVDTPEKILNADRLVLPGVGAFGAAMDKLNAAGLTDAIIRRARAGVPLLGVCLGMQLLFEKSFEFGEHEGLSLLKGEVRPMTEYIKENVKIPHMGWNSLTVTRPCALTENVKNGDFVYYVHSFMALDCQESLSAYSEYGGASVAGIVSLGNVFGCQFHPEKSGAVGLQMLKAFSEVK